MSTIDGAVEKFRNGNAATLRNIVRDYFPWILTLVVYLVGGFFFTSLFRAETFQVILLQSTAVTILALGMAFSLIVAEIDLSIVSALLFAPLVGIIAVQTSALAWLPGIAALPIAIGAAVVIGYINGFVVTKIGVPSLIQTLAMWWTLQGAVLSLTQGQTITILPDLYQTLAFGSVGPISYLIVLTVIVVAATWYFSVKTAAGRRLFLVGGDSEASSRMGIDDGKYRRYAFLLSAVLAAVGGIALVARVGVLASGIGSQLLMPAIAAPVIAGVSLFGGTGKIINVPAGAILVQLILTITRVAGISGYEFRLVQGLLVFVIVVAMELKRRNSLSQLFSGVA